jgi:nucleotide-binding universal stress UspA family protein
MPHAPHGADGRSLGGPVLATTDLAEAADEALRQGRTLAAGLHAPFVVCHILPEDYRVRVLFPQDAGIDRAAEEELVSKARAVVGARLHAVLGRGAESGAIEIESGSPHAGILEVADRIGAGVIVMGPGPTALRVARAAGRPVLIARPSAAGDVIGATDFSDPALPAVRLAASEARRRGAELRLVHCLDVDETIVMPPVPTAIIDRLEADARARLLDALKAAGMPGKIEALRRRAADGILEAAGTPPAALVVIGTHGRSGWSRVMLGSVAEAVISRAPCSVLVARLHAGE